jgi:DNA-binding HxlR family transcriptional regulator
MPELVAERLLVTEFDNNRRKHSSPPVPPLPIRATWPRATPSRPAAGSEACAQSDASLVRAFELLGRRWTGVILGTLSDRPASFRELARAVPGTSDSMLSTRLAALTKAGLLTRRSTKVHRSQSPTS